MTQVNEKKAAVTPRGVRSPETCFSSLNSVVAQQHPGMGTGFAGRKRRKQGFDFNTLLQLFKYFLLFTNVSFLWDLNKFVSMMWPLPIGSYMPPASHLGQRRGVCMHRNRAQDIHYKTKKKKKKKPSSPLCATYMLLHVWACNGAWSTYQWLFKKTDSPSSRS